MKHSQFFYLLWFLIRIILGMIFIYSGLSKLLAPLTETRALFYEYAFLPTFAVPWIALLFPWLEFITGLFLVLGYMTRLAATAVMGFTFCFILLLGSEWLLKGHFPEDCGCFAGSWKLPTPAIFLMDIVNFILIVQLARIRKHLWSLDQWIKSSSGWVCSWSLRLGVVGIVVAVSLAAVVLGLSSATSPIFEQTATSSASSATHRRPPFLKQMGNPDARIEILEYTDFQCPACQAAKPILTGIMARYPGQTRLIFKHYPLSGHVWAKPAHRAAECAHVQGHFWPYHDLLYGNQQIWAGEKASEIFEKFAADLSLDVTRFQSCLNSSEPDISVEADIAEAKGRGVNATPTFFINGERLVGSREIQLRCDEVIQRFLKENAKS